MAPELNAHPPPTKLLRTPLRRFWWLLPLTALLACAGYVLLAQGQEETLVAQARRQMDAGHAEAAERALARLVRRPLLTTRTRYEGAELFFRLGEDHAANALLKGLTPHPDNPRDRRLQDLAQRCQRAAALLGRCDRATQPAERLRLASEALEQTPESPLVLRRTVEEELLAISRSTEKAPPLMERFAADYRRLRETAPLQAADVKRRVAAALGSQTN